MRDALPQKIREALTPDLLKPRFRGSGIPYYGHCYVASEALYHALGGKEAGYTPVRARDSEGTVHWWLEDGAGTIIDVTKDQYESRGLVPPYAEGRRAGFLTKGPSKRAAILLARIR